MCQELQYHHRPWYNIYLREISIPDRSDWSSFLSSFCLHQHHHQHQLHPSCHYLFCSFFFPSSPSLPLLTITPFYCIIYMYVSVYTRSYCCPLLACYVRIGHNQTGVSVPWCPGKPKFLFLFLLFLLLYLFLAPFSSISFSITIGVVG